VGTSGNGTARAPLESNYGDGCASRRLSRRVDKGMGNDVTEDGDGTAWAHVQAEHLFPM